ncbi:hypothetical protein Angca_005875, partial [Angiostrongylus cantonensis]
VCLWDYFGGDTCMDVNCWAGTEMNVVAEEYQIRPLSQSEFLRLPLRWSLVRIVSDQPQAALGLIPSCWLVAKKFLQENPGLFSYPYWYLGICDVDTAYNHLISDRSAQRPGVFVIFSPICMNPDPSDYRPFLLMMLCEAVKRTAKLQDDVIERERCGEWTKRLHGRKGKNRAFPESSTKKDKDKSADFVIPDTFPILAVLSRLYDIARNVYQRKKGKRRVRLRGEKKREKAGRQDIEIEGRRKRMKAPPQSVYFQILTITRSISGHYELFGNRYNTLYDLVYHLSQTKSELPHKLLYGTLSKPPPLPFCAVPPPMEQPRRDPRANLMHCEQWAARQFDQAVLPSLLATPFQHVSRSVVDPFKQLHMKILKTAERTSAFEGIHLTLLYRSQSKLCSGISDKGKRAVMVNGVTIQKEITSYMEKFDRPIKKEKQRDNEGKEQEKLAKNKLGKGAFGAVYAGEFKTRNGNTVAVAVKSLRLVCTDKDQRLPWIAEVEMMDFFQQLKHPNVVRFFGFTLEAAESNILLIFEMMDKGALDSFCRKINYQISVNETVDWLCQIARGMAHLHAQIPVIVHGDLAARNVLVCSHPVDVTRYILKITDFGISKRTRSETFATYDDPNKIPFKWLPPEVLKSREMTPKADVWSFGMLVHELYGIGEPYGMLGPEKVIHALNDGHRFERQPKMPHFIYDVVLQCWRRLPVDRPHFREIELYLLPHYIEYEAAHMDIISERIRKQEAGSKGNDKKTDE